MTRNTAERAADRPARIPLPAPARLEGGLEAILRSRRSRYHFAREPLELASLSTLLHFSAGVQRRRRTPDGREHLLGFAPSAGGLPVMRTVVFARDVEGLPTGIHRYGREHHELLPLWAGDPTAQMRDIFVQQEFATSAPMTLAVIADLDVAYSRYGPGHYRTLHVDAGILTQNLYLVSTALGLSCCAVVGFREQELMAAARCTSTELPIILMPLGRRGDLKGSRDREQPAGSAL